MNIPPANCTRAKPTPRTTASEAKQLHQETKQLLRDWEGDHSISKPHGLQHLTGANSQSALENWNDVTPHDPLGLKTPVVLEARMLRPMPSQPPFGEISSI